MKRTILILAMMSGSQSMYGQPFIYGVNGYEGLVRVNAANGERTVLLAEFPGAWLTSIAFSSSTSELIVGTETGFIIRTKIEGARWDTLLTGASFDSLHAGRGGSSCGHHALAVDESENKIYAMGGGWCGSHFISMNLDGSDLKWIGDVHEGGSNLAIDPESRRVYFSRWAGVTSYIMSKELDGTDQDTLITENDVPGASDDIWGAVFDFESGAMYWTNEGWIKRANLDGSEAQTIAELDATLLSSMLLDPVNRYLYFSEADNSSTLWRVNLDGTGKTPVSQGGLLDMLILPSTVTSLTPREGVPDVMSLRQNYPNPFSPDGVGTTIGYTLRSTDHVTITVRDILGRLVAVLVDEVRPAGSYSASWVAGSDTPSGTYFYTLETSEGAVTKSGTLLK